MVIFLTLQQLVGISVLDATIAHVPAVLLGQGPA